MAFGDAIMATNLARGLHARGKLAAFGLDGKTISWTRYCEEVFKNNPNVARKENEKQDNLVWFKHYKRNIPYCKLDGKKYIWNYKFKAQRGEMFFLDTQLLPMQPKPFIVIEPNVAWQRAVNVNKDWGIEKYNKLSSALIEHGHTVVQFIHANSRHKLKGALHLPTQTFHQAVQIMSRCSLFIGPEGANHHAAAAVDVPAVIVWGAWSPPQTMGYDSQIMLTGGATEACGNLLQCSHCRAAFDRITVEEVYQAALRELH